MKEETLYNHVLNIENYVRQADIENDDLEVKEHLDKAIDEIVLIKLKYR